MWRGHHDVIDENAGDADLLRTSRRIEQPPHLGNDDSATVAGCLSDGQDFADNHFFVGHQVAKRVCSSAADQADVDGKGVVP